MMQWWYFGGPFGGIGMVMMVLWWALIIAGIVWFVRWIMNESEAGRGKHRRPAPLEILKERYAKGEITQKEYEEMKRGIGG